MNDHQARLDLLKSRRERLLSVKEYAYLARLHPVSVYRRIREGRQPGVHRFGGVIRLNPPDGSPPV